MSGADLEGVGVLVTRPRDWAQPLAAGVRAIGGVPVMFPGMEIELVEAATLKAQLVASGRIDLAIFVSPTAARLGVPPLLGVLGRLDSMRLAAVGQSTVSELRKFGIVDIIAPAHGSGAEALAACPELADMAGRNVLIVRGENGSEVLETVLGQRGARIDFLECYRRRLPRADFGEIGKMLVDGRVGAWMATSGEILDNLLRLAGDKSDLLRRTPLFVNHPHVAVRAFSSAVRTIFVSAGGDRGLVNGLATWFCRSRSTC